MKTEDIDKRIGMPDVDKEWARFEQEVIGKETKRHSALAWALGIGIAASVALLLIFNTGKEQTEQTTLIVQTEEIKPQPTPQPIRKEMQAKEQELVTKVPKPLITQNKKLAMAKANAPAASSLDIPAREYTGAVQKFKMDDIEDLAFESVDQALQGQIAERDIASADLGSGTTMRLRGTGSGPSDKDRIDSTLILVNGEPLPDSLKWQVFGESIDDVDTYMPRYFSKQGLMIDSVYVHKDSYYTEKYGGRAKYGVIEITTVPDTYSDAYVCKHPKLKKKYHRVEGYMFDNNGKPLTEAYVHVERDFFIGAATDSTGHFVFWVPRKDVTLRAEQPGYKSFEFYPSDLNLVIHLEKSYNGYNMRLRGNSQEQIAGLPKYVPEENEVRLLPQGVIRGSHNSPPNDSILYLINGVPQPKENNKWLDKRSYLDYFKGQHLLVSRVMDYMNVKQRYIEKYGEAAKHGVIEYICVEDTLCDYYMDQHEELKASRRRVTGVVYDENDEPLEHTMIHIFHDRRIWGTETTDSTGHFVFWVPRTDATLHFKYIGYKAVVVEATDTFHTIYLLPEATERSMK